MEEQALGLYTSVMNMIYNSREAEKQREWQEKMWGKQVHYNDPQNVKARLLAAGINPYSQLDAVPAGSAGQGASASGMPFQITSPLDSLMKLAQIKNIDANTENLGSETGLNVAKLGEVLVAVEMGLISRDEASYMLKKKMEAFDEKNPFSVEIATKEADTAESLASAESHRASAGLANANAAYVDAQRITEELLRPEKLELLKSQSSAQRAAAAAALASALSYQAQARYNSALADKASTEAAVAAALKDVEIRIRKLQESGLVTDNQLKRYEAEKERIIRNPTDSRELWQKIEFLFRDLISF